MRTESNCLVLSKTGLQSVRAPYTSTHPWRKRSGSNALALSVRRISRAVGYQLPISSECFYSFFSYSLRPRSWTTGHIHHTGTCDPGNQPRHVKTPLDGVFSYGTLGIAPDILRAPRSFSLRSMTIPGGISSGPGLYDPLLACPMNRMHMGRSCSAKSPFVAFFWRARGVSSLECAPSISVYWQWAEDSNPHPFGALVFGTSGRPIRPCPLHWSAVAESNRVRRGCNPAARHSLVTALNLVPGLGYPGKTCMCEWVVSYLPG